MTVSANELVDALRASLTENERLRAHNAELVDRAREPIAVVAMGCRMPGGVRGPDDLWRIVDDGIDATSEVPADRPWRQALEAGLGADVHPRGGFVDGIDRFDPSLFGISPREATAMDPQQRLLLETAWETFERAGLVPADLRGSATGVFVGAAGTGYGTNLRAVPDGVGPYMVTGTATSVVSGRLAYTFGLEGPAVTLDTACSSSLVAVHQAVQALRRRDCEMALAGGVSVMSTAGTFLGFSGYGVMARDGRCKAFSDSADGAGWAEGAGLLLVERLSDALRNGHPVLAVIRGSAVNSDGASNGLTAPNGPSQQRVVRAALADAGLGPADVDVVEAHGTGTRLGDPIEVHALQSTYGRERPAEQPLLLGSLKSNLGHTQAASGVAGIVKTVLALGRGRVPSSLFGDEPSTQIDWDGGGVELCGTARDWPETGRPRRAAVSSFGISGTNAHVVLEQAPAIDTPITDGSRVLRERVPLMVSAARPDTLAAQAAAVRDLLQRRPELPVDAVAAALATTRTAFPHRGIAVVRDREEAVAALDALAAGAAAPGVVTAVAAARPKVAFVFPGQGGQYAGMARELLATSPVFAAALADCDRALAPVLGHSVTDLLVGEPEEWLDRVELVQPALWAVMVALARLWQAHGLTPTAVVGHSQGEIAAACVAGALSLEDGARVVALRAAAIADLLAGQGAMASLALPPDAVAERLEDMPGVHVATLNGPSSTVVAGVPDQVAAVVAACVADGLRARVLPVDYASHTSYVDALRERLATDLATIRPRTGEIPFFSTVTASWADTARLDAGYWFDNLRRPVRFDESVAALRAEGCTAFVEIGPHPVLAADVTARLEIAADPAEAPAAVVATLRRGEDADHRFATAVADAVAHGLPVDRAALFAGIAPLPAAQLPGYAFADDRFWLTDPAGATDVAGAGLTSTDHPLLGAAVAVAGRDEHVLTGRLTGDGPLPSAALLDALLRAADESGAAGLRDVVVERSLARRSGEPVDVQVVVGAPGPDGTREIALHARAGADWVRHATARTAAPPGVEIVPDPDAPTVSVDEAVAGYVLHPALFDAAVRTLGDPDAELVSVGSVAVLRSGATQVQVTASGTDLLLTDPAGEIVAVLTGVVTGTLTAPPTAAVLVRGWVPCEIGEAVPARWAVVGAGDRAIAEPLRAANAVVAEAGTLAELTAGPAPDRVLLDLTSGAPAVAATVLAAAQALVAAPGWDEVSLVAVTRGAVTTSTGDPVTDPAAAAAWGLLGSAAAEHPGRFAVLDLDDGPLPLAAFDAAAEPRLALRAGTLLAARLQPATPPAGTGPAIDTERTVLVTGGTGTLGALVARHLVTAHGARHLVLLGRRGPDAPGAAALAADLTAAGATVDVRACDVADADAVAEVLAGIDVGTVVHAAGTLADSALTGITADSLDAVLAPKTGGLTALLDGCPDAQVVLFSSVAGVLGSAGQANYAAANAVLDATAEQLRAAGRRATSLAWGLWEAESELTAGLSDTAKRRLAATGTRAIGVDEGMAMLDAALTAPVDGPAVRVLFPFTAGRTPADPDDVPAMLRALVPTTRRRAAAAAGPASSSLRDRLAVTPPGRRLGTVLEIVRAQVAVVLGYADADAVAPDRPYQELGLDSVTMLDLRNRLGAATGTAVGVTACYDHPTPLATAGWLLDGPLGEGLPVAGDPVRTEAAAGLPAVRDSEPDADPVVIVASALRVPGGVETPDAFWEMLDTGAIGVGRLPEDRGWDREQFLALRAMLPGIDVVTDAGFVADAAGFDPELFGITPEEALVMDPQQRLLLELAWETFERAGTDPHGLAGSRVGVYLGTFFQNYIGDLRRVPETSMPYVSTATGSPFACARVAYALGLDGPTLTVDTGCSSSAIALHLATQAVRAGECTSALVGGITVMAFPAAFPDLGGMSPDGRCRSFSGDADGTGWGEGAGMVLVERLSEARRHGHPVLAVVRGSAVNHNGSGNGLSAPNGPSQRVVMERALEAAGLAATDVDAVEGHGTGTLLGDEIEAEAVIAAYGADRGAAAPVLLGSTKANTGHPHAASGVLGVIAATLMLAHDHLPAVAHAENPLPRLDGSTGVRLRTSAAPWPRADRPRRIGVSSFGGSGSKAHIVLEQAPPALPTEDRPDPQVLAFPLSAATTDALQALAGRLRDAVADGQALPDIARTLGTGRAALPSRATVVTGDRAELVAALDALADDLEHPALRTGTPAVRAPGGDLLALAFTDNPAGTSALFGGTDSEGVAAAAALAALGIVPDVVIGAGRGELVAAEVGGLLTADDVAAVVAGRPVSPRLPRVPCLTAAGAEIDPVAPGDSSGDLTAHAPVTLVVDGDRISVAGAAAETLMDVLAEAWRHGVPVDWAAAFGPGAVADLPTYPFRNRPFWLGATSEDVPEDLRTEPDETVRKAVITEYYRRLNAGDLDGVVEMFAEDGRIEDPLGQPPAVGHDALRRFFEVTIKQGDIRDRVGPMVAAHDGRSIAVSVTADMINVQDPDGGRVEVEAIMTFQVDGRGRITEARTFWGASDVTFAVPQDGVQARI